MKFKLIAALLGFAMAIPGVVSAQMADDQVSAQDSQQAQGSYDQGSNTPASAETSGGAARISLIKGQVSTQRGDTGDWSAAALNAPMVAGDKISTGDSARAEVQLDYANILRLSERSQANIGTLSQKDIQVQLGQGLATYTVFKDGEANVELDTPNASVHPGAGDGSYRILVVSDSETDVVVRRGEAEIATPQGRTRVGGGHRIIVRGTGSETTYRIADATPRDDWDRWNSDRDNLIQNAEGRRHTNRYYVGSQDLDAYGHWRTVPDYGPVWSPAVDSGWAPYRDGQWVWEPGWGWTWVSYEPWGWAPYHYGRWFLYDDAWVWWPGPAYGYPFYRPLWAPAYVSFFGFGGGFGFGFGSFGWLPVGPCDFFFPWWGFNHSRFNVINVTNITIINNFNRFHGRGIPPLRTGTRFSNLRLATTNDRMRRAISAVNAKDFGHGRVTPQPVSHEAFRGGRMMAGNLPVAPTRASLSASGRPAAASTVPAPGRQQAHFFGRTPASANRPSFDREAAQVQSAIRQNARFTPANENRSAQMSQGRPDPRVQGSGTTRANSAPDWRRSGQASQVAPGAQTHAGPSIRGSVPNRGSESWRQIPRPGVTNQPAGANSGMNPASRGANVNTPRERQIGNQNSAPDWRHFPSPRSVEPNPRGGSVMQPNSRIGGEPASNPSRNDSWRTFPRNDRPSSSESVNRGPSGSSSGNGNWRQASPRTDPRVSRPPLEMRRPIVTPRSSGPSYSGPRSSGPSYSAPRSSGPGYSAPHSSAPSGRSGSSGGSRSSGSGSHSGGNTPHR